MLLLPATLLKNCLPATLFKKGLTENPEKRLSLKILALNMYANKPVSCKLEACKPDTSGETENFWKNENFWPSVLRILEKDF